MQTFFTRKKLLLLLNFNCIFTTCNYKQNNIEESEFLKHLQNEHTKEIIDISKKENMSIKAVEMITISNSRVFINSNYLFSTEYNYTKYQNKIDNIFCKFQFIS